MSNHADDPLYQQGRDEVLAEVAQLPSPVDSDMREGDAETNYAKFNQWCSWCHSHWVTVTTFYNEQLQPHPDNGCLWVRAQKPLTEGLNTPTSDTAASPSKGLDLAASDAGREEETR